MAKKGKLYLIPTPLGEENGDHVLPRYVVEVIRQLDIFIAEKAKTARRYIKAINHPKAISELVFSELNKRIDYQEWSQYLKPAEMGNSIGLLSEAGCPGVADPGAEIVKLAHEKGIEVIPLVGPSSLLLALMASGMNGQSFAFHGYLSPKKERVGKDLKRLEQIAKREKQTQLFIETPYRNGQLVEQAFKVLGPQTRFCIAIDLTLPNEYIVTKTIAEWRTTRLPELHKRPAVFLLM
ncbi:MAG: SAM-dependent methyltransferase [Bacteroidota bacterium]